METQIKKLATETLQSLRTAWQGDLLRTHKPRATGGDIYKPVNVYASKRRECTRQMALDMLHPEDDGDFNNATRERFEQGNEAQANLISRLMRMARFCDPPFQVIEQEHRFVVNDRDGIQLVTGRMDARLKFTDGPRPPVEIKSGRTYENAETVEDLDNGVWSRGSVDELLSYMLGAEEAWGFIMCRRQGREPSMIPVILEDHLERAEQFLKTARQAVDARHGRADLPAFTENTMLCRKCSHHGKSCTPPGLDFGKGMRVIADPMLIQLAEIREKSYEAHTQFEKADKILKQELRGTEMGVLGPFNLTGKWMRSTTYNIPDKIKEKYKEVNPAGKFKLTIERV